MLLLSLRSIVPYFLGYFNCHASKRRRNVCSSRDWSIARTLLSATWVTDNPHWKMAFHHHKTISPR